MDFWIFPGAKTVLAVARGLVVRRTETDAVDRARRGRATQAAVDRRADQGPCACDHRGIDRMLCRAKAPRRHHPARRAEFPCRAPDRRRRAGNGQWPHRPPRRHGGSRRRRAVAGTAARAQPGGTSMTELAATDALPKPKRDWLPALLPVILA